MSNKSKKSTDHKNKISKSLSEYWENKSNIIPCERCGKDKQNAKKLCNACSVTLSRRKKLNDIKVELGGKCTMCGYDKCLPAIEFHHIDPTLKEFAISRGVTLGHSKIKILEEVKKCVMVCANCHREIHEELEY